MLDIQELKTEHQAVLLTMSILDQIMSKPVLVPTLATKTHTETANKELQKTGLNRWAKIIRAIVLNDRASILQGCTGVQSFVPPGSTDD